MNKYTNIFKMSFIFYVLVILASGYVTAQVWADIIFILFICSVIYQLIYLIYLRKKDNKKFFASLGLYFLFVISSVSAVIIINYIKYFIFGYTPSDFLGNTYDATYYGFRAIVENEWENIFYVPWLIINAIIISIYYIIKKRK